MPLGGNHVQSVLQGSDHGSQILPGRLFRPWKIQQQAAAPDPGHSPGQHSRGVTFSPSPHMATGMAGISRSSTARVASGVTSQGDSPVPPVVTMGSILLRSAQSRSSARICSISSGRMAVCATENPASSSMARTAGPLVSCRSTFSPHVVDGCRNGSQADLASRRRRWSIPVTVWRTSGMRCLPCGKGARI